MSTLQTVHVRVNDAATGQPTPVRIRFTGPDGQYLAPLGRLTEFARGRNVDVGGNLDQGAIDPSSNLLTRQKYCYIDGACEIRLPAGNIGVEIHKGPEYTPVHETIRLPSGKLALRFAVQRWIDPHAQRWYSGDIRAHFLTPHGALLEGMAEGLAVVNVLASMTNIQEVGEWLAPGDDPRTYPAIPNLLAFSGQQSAVATPDCMVVVNTFNRHWRLGALALLNCHRIVYPLVFGRPWEEFDNWTLADWCDQCHRKGGLVVWAETDMPPIERHYGEALADSILAKVDAVEITRFPLPFEAQERRFDWYGLLNCGCRAPLAGGSGKDSNCVPLGAVRTYGRLGQDQKFNYRSWIEAIRAGRTFVTNGPLLFFSVNGKDPGEMLKVARGEPVQVRAECRSGVPVERLEIIANGVVVADKAVDLITRTACLETELTLPSGGWLAARCWGRGWMPGYFVGQQVHAHSSPIYVQVHNQPYPVDRAAVQSFLGHLDRTMEWVNHEGRYQSDAQRERLAGILQAARDVLLKRASASV